MNQQMRTQYNNTGWIIKVEHSIHFALILTQSWFQKVSERAIS